MHIAIVGKNYKGLRNYLKSRGYTYTVLRDKIKQDGKHRKNTVYIDFNDLENEIRKIEQLPKIDACMAVYEQYVEPCAVIARALKLPGLPIEAAAACTDKSKMRELFAKAPKKISPAFKKISSENDLIEFAKNSSFPLIIKPTNLAKSLLVTRCDDLEELIGAYNAAKEIAPKIYAKYAPRASLEMIVEEFMEGSIHSIDAYIDKNGKVSLLDDIVDYQTGYDIGFDDNFHYSRVIPSKLSHSIQKEFRDVAVKAVEALGMKSSAAHIEIIVTIEGPRVVEIGARNGGYRERMHELANGIDILGNQLSTILDQPLDITPKKNEPCAVLELFPKTPGIFSGIQNEDLLKGLQSFNYLSIKPKIGDFVGKSSQGYKASAVIVLHSNDSSVFQNDLQFVNDQVCVTTKLV
ncbi:ATP-grasp domain-containing protein [Candidatus Saccharibacteria bacterium]|nr:MAG: ATP-grasp domain-containing protein [Candidatus Saccharibacteria bacterium]